VSRCEGTEGVVETVGFKKTTECVWWRTSANVRREWVPDWGVSSVCFQSINQSM